ncbi:hypothetical protein HQQ80_06205 [Microbacteriaceae bacterium VKM Ac-2855]|nr:hypothetical protein [Microbacteriaceae bacterium VKM Ac-2855]
MSERIGELLRQRDIDVRALPGADENAVFAPVERERAPDDHHPYRARDGNDRRVDWTPYLVRMATWFGDRQKIAAMSG